MDKRPSTAKANAVNALLAPAVVLAVVLAMMPAAADGLPDGPHPPLVRTDSDSLRTVVQVPVPGQGPAPASTQDAGADVECSGFAPITTSCSVSTTVTGPYSYYIAMDWGYTGYLTIDVRTPMAEDHIGCKVIASSVDTPPLVDCEYRSEGLVWMGDPLAVQITSHPYPVGQSLDLYHAGAWEGGVQFS